MAFTFKKDNKMKYYGDTDFDKHLVRINKRMAKHSGEKGELLNTIVHESLHVKHPNKGERKVGKLTKRVTKKLSKKSKAKMYAKVK